MKRMDKIVISIVFIAMVAFALAGCDGFRGYYDTDYEDAYNDSVESRALDDYDKYEEGYRDGWTDARNEAVDLLLNYGHDEAADIVEGTL